MDVNDIRKIFGSMPIEALSAAQMLQKKKNQKVVIAVLTIGSFFLGICVAANYYKKKLEIAEQKDLTMPKK